MLINLNVKIKGGLRTPIEVSVYYSTPANEKTMRFANGEEVSKKTIAEWIQANLTIALLKRQSELKPR